MWCIRVHLRLAAAAFMINECLGWRNRWSIKRLMPGQTQFTSVNGLAAVAALAGIPGGKKTRFFFLSLFWECHQNRKVKWKWNHRIKSGGLNSISSFRVTIQQRLNQTCLVTFLPWNSNCRVFMSYICTLYFATKDDLVQCNEENHSRERMGSEVVWMKVCCTLCERILQPVRVDSSHRPQYCTWL